MPEVHRPKRLERGDWRVKVNLRPELDEEIYHVFSDEGEAIKQYGMLRKFYTKGE